jgi:hypothetical protein
MSPRLPLALRRLDGETCPQCETAAVYASGDPEILGFAVCGECGAAWERVDRAMLTDAANLLSPFHEPCNNCAFRPGSREQQDTAGWRDLIGRLKDGEQFFCHKGVPLKGFTGNAADVGFDYPQREAVVELEGERIVVDVPDRSRLRVCAGYLRMIVAKKTGRAA